MRESRRRILPETTMRWTWAVLFLLGLAPVSLCRDQSWKDAITERLASSDIVKWREAFAAIDSTLEAADQFRNDPAVPKWAAPIGRHQEAREILASLSEPSAKEKKAVYLLFAEPKAEALLKRYRATASIELLEEAIRRFPGTAAADEAQYQLGVHHLDRARPDIGLSLLEELGPRAPAERKTLIAHAMGLGQTRFAGEGLPTTEAYVCHVSAKLTNPDQETRKSALADLESRLGRRALAEWLARRAPSLGIPGEAIAKSMAPTIEPLCYHATSEWSRYLGKGEKEGTLLIQDGTALVEWTPATNRAETKLPPDKRRLTFSPDGNLVVYRKIEPARRLVPEKWSSIMVLNRRTGQNTELIGSEAWASIAQDLAPLVVGKDFVALQNTLDGWKAPAWWHTWALPSGKKISAPPPRFWFGYSVHLGPTMHVTLDETSTSVMARPNFNPLYHPRFEIDQTALKGKVKTVVLDDDQRFAVITVARPEGLVMQAWNMASQRMLAELPVQNGDRAFGYWPVAGAVLSQRPGETPGDVVVTARFLDGTSVETRVRGEIADFVSSNDGILHAKGWSSPVCIVPLLQVERDLEPLSKRVVPFVDLEDSTHASKTKPGHSPISPAQ